jgi:uncharacterized surface protein with fasciclin (FAS1) repeats
VLLHLEEEESQNAAALTGTNDSNAGNLLFDPQDAQSTRAFVFASSMSTAMVLYVDPAFYHARGTRSDQDSDGGETIVSASEEADGTEEHKDTMGSSTTTSIEISPDQAASALANVHSHSPPNEMKGDEENNSDVGFYNESKVSIARLGWAMPACRHRCCTTSDPPKHFRLVCTRRGSDGWVEVLASLQSNNEYLTAVLSNHLVFEVLPTVNIAHGQSYGTLSGQAVHISYTSNNTLMVNNAHIIKSDVLAINGILHIIDKILLEPYTQPSDPVLTDWPNRR